MSDRAHSKTSPKSLQMTASVLATVSAVSLLSASININGLELPMLRLAPNTQSIAETASTLMEEAISALPRATRLTALQPVVEVLQSGGIAHTLLYVISTIHLVLFALAVTLAIASIISCWKERERDDAGRGTSLASSIVSLTECVLICGMCGAVTALTAAAQHSLVQGDPYAVGRGVDAIDISIAPGLATIVAMVLAVVTIIVWIAAIVCGKRTTKADNK